MKTLDFGFDKKYKQENKFDWSDLPQAGRGNTHFSEGTKNEQTFKAKKLKDEIIQHNSDERRLIFENLNIYSIYIFSQQLIDKIHKRIIWV